jgi:hypothetical protein
VGVPTITLHTSRDPLVPFPVHEPPFAGLVQGANQSSLLLQRTVDGFGHCTFSTQQMVDGLQTLAGWVTSGVKPTN